MDLSDNSTEVSENFNNSQNEDVEIDGPSLTKEQEMMEALKNTSLNENQK